MVDLLKDSDPYLFFLHFILLQNFSLIYRNVCQLIHVKFKV